MKRLIDGIGKNSNSEYDRIFKERKTKGVNWFDLKRWKALIKYFDGGAIIDLGCLDSGISDLIKSGIYYGLDLAEESIREMNKEFGWVNAKFVVGDLYDTKIKSNSFDYAILGEVLEHLEDPAKAIKEAFRILKPEGILAISTPLEEEKEPGAVDGYRHIWSFNKKDIADLLKPYCDGIEIDTIGSQWIPYKYAWPSIIGFGWKR